MKRIVTTVVIAVLLSPAGSLFAACPDFHQEIFGGGSGGTSFWSFDTSCASTSGNVSDGTMSCYTWPANQFTTGSGSADYSMTVPTGHGGSTWSVSIYVDFDDPSGYSANGLSASVTVWHNGTVSHSDGFFIHNGNQGSMSCSLVGTSQFSVSDGDTIDVSYNATNYNGATMKITPPNIFEN